MWTIIHQQSCTERAHWSVIGATETVDTKKNCIEDLIDVLNKPVIPGEERVSWKQPCHRDHHGLWWLTQQRTVASLAAEANTSFILGSPQEGAVA